MRKTIEKLKTIINHYRNPAIEGDNANENRQLCPSKMKLKATSNGQQLSRCEMKSTGSSALIVATAASKWRRKRRSSYLFGPPQRTDIDCDKRKSVKDIPKSASATFHRVHLISLESPKSKTGVKNEDKTNSGALKTVVQPPRKGGRIGKRNREKDKIRACVSETNMQARAKAKLGCNSYTKTNNPDSSKLIIKIENFIGDNKINKKKKLENSFTGEKHFKLKSLCSSEKQKKEFTKQRENIKTIILPFDKSSAASKGFKGRTKNRSPLLWGNGRDWRTPVHREGNWGRIYPINNFSAKYNPTLEEDCQGNKFSIGDKQIRLVVHHITNFIRISKQIYYKEVNATEEELSSRLINHLGMTGDVWLPSK